jgi:hypothetical protein
MLLHCVALFGLLQWIRSCWIIMQFKRSIQCAAQLLQALRMVAAAAGVCFASFAQDI